MGLDVAEMGGVSEEIYAKLRKEFGVQSPLATPMQSQLGGQARAKRLLSLDDKAKLKLEQFAVESEERLPQFGQLREDEEEDPLDKKDD